MKNSPEIWNELVEISPLVAGILRQDDLYSIPAGYFDNLSENLLSRIKAGQTEILPEILGQMDKKPSFPIPGNYFDHFPEKLMSLIKANEALSVGEEIKGLSIILSQMEKKTPYILPSGYFDALSEQLIDRIHTEGSEYQEIQSSLLNDIKISTLYQIPVGYFDKLPESILARVKPSAKVVSFGPARRTFLRYAAAAVIAGGLLIGGSLFFNRNASTAVEAVPLATVSDQEILNYLEAQNVPFSDINNIASVVEVNESDAKDLLNDVSDEELQQYLNEHVSAKELKDN